MVEEDSGQEIELVDSKTFEFLTPESYMKLFLLESWAWLLIYVSQVSTFKIIFNINGMF